MTAVASYFIINFMLPEIMKMDFFGVGIIDVPRMNVFGSVIIGLVVGAAISYFTEYYTGLGKKPVMSIY